MKKLYWPVLFVICVILVFFIYLYFTYPTSSPFTSFFYIVETLTHPHAKMKKEVMGFLPYWRMDDSKYIKFDLLTEVNFFSLNIDGKGNFVKVVKNETDPGWLVWNQQRVKDLITKTRISGGEFTVTIMASQNNIIDNLLKNQSAQDNLIRNIVSEVESRHLDGVTIDFEYQGNADSRLKTAFTAFTGRLSEELHKVSDEIDFELTLLPTEDRSEGLFDIPRLVKVVNRFVGMTYDYYGANSEIAGPVAPMKGFAEKKYFFDVTTAYNDYLKYIPKEKILMGIPYYGWDWAVADGKKIQSAVLPQNDKNNYAAVMSYGRMRERKEFKKDQCQWDDYAEEEWCWYVDGKGVEHQVWLENDRSIGIKFGFAKERDFAGTAIWVLGYDKDYPDLWNLMEKMFADRK